MRDMPYGWIQTKQRMLNELEERNSPVKLMQYISRVGGYWNKLQREIEKKQKEEEDAWRERAALNGGMYEGI